MYVQWCAKGLNSITDDQAKSVMLDGDGLKCRWWHNARTITPNQILEKLTLMNLDWHVNRYSDTDPRTGRPFYEGTPFISLSAGTVERSVFYQTNFVHTALGTAASFATASGTVVGYVFVCYVIVALNQAVGIQSVSEEVRELKTYRRYSSYNLEGEVAAKIFVPANQIWLCVKLESDLSVVWVERNPAFVEPSPILNQRSLI